MRFLSLCSGIEAASVAWSPLGFEAVAFSEIEKFPSEVLRYHYPDVPNLGDMTKINGKQFNGAVNIMVGGTPCQAFSVAGLRKSLEDDRGSLTLRFAQLADEIEPEFVVWENVPGVLNAKDNAFGCFLGALAGENVPLEPPGGRWTNAGYVLGPKRAAAWRVLDAQYFGVAQRRRRVYLVACPRRGADPREVLFESEGVRRDSPPRREAGQDVASPITTSPYADNAGHESLLIFCRQRSDEYKTGDIASTLAARDCKSATDLVCGSKCGQATHTVLAQNQANACAVSESANLSEVTMSITASYGRGGVDIATKPLVFADPHVRRLTPVECERLQGFPDSYTLIPVDKRKKIEDDYRAYLKQHYPDISNEELERLAKDSPRYKALGNSMAVPVMRWIGKRISEAAK